MIFVTRQVLGENIINKDQQYDFTLEDKVIAYEEVLRIRAELEKLLRSTT